MQRLLVLSSWHTMLFSPPMLQVMDLVTVAAAPVNTRHWRAPEVVVYFPSGVTGEVAAAIMDLGATVADGPGELAWFTGVLNCCCCAPGQLAQLDMLHCQKSLWLPCWL